ncbi:MAG: hypothetical protein RQ756_06640 [Flavobacteriaceae bacterium]|nr:hypothetical protein [Flavobacteriaceae bacterium]
MKTQFLYLSLLLITFITACSDSDDAPIDFGVLETQDLVLLSNIEKADHSILLFSKNQELTTGYNELFIQLKDLDGNYIDTATFNWEPIMDMGMMMHSAPYSDIARTPNTQTLYSGYIVFQMPSAADLSNSWTLELDYSIHANDYIHNETLFVNPSTQKNISVFEASNGNNYILALIEPSQPQIGGNDLVIGLFQRVDMHHFPIADNYSIKVDPRMPGMGNHSSPNNMNCTQSTTDNFYHGLVNFNMTGAWTINLMLENESQQVIMGEEVTDTTPTSSIYLEVTF